MLERLLSICDPTSEIFKPNRFAAPAATIQAFLGGSVGTTLPSRAHWIQAYNSDMDLRLIRNIIANPSLLSNKSLREINYNYHSVLRKSLIMLEDGILIYREPITGNRSYTRLQLIPRDFYNILFVTFHSNPVGGHLNAYHTLHCLRFCFYWPGMYSYVKRMCCACPGCALANPTKGCSCELVYNFPIKAPSWCCTLTPIWQVPTLDSRIPTFTLSHVAVCALLAHWSLSQALTPPRLLWP